MVTDTPYSSDEMIMPAWLGAVLGCVAGYFVDPSFTLLFGFAGWLYALCQQKCSLLGFVLVGLSYGIMLWIGSRLAHGIHLVPDWNLKSFLAFSEGLAICSIVLSLTRKTSSAALPKD